MKRRTFFRAATATGIALVAPPWVSHAFAQDDRDPDEGLAALSRAYQRSQRRGHPLLVLVVPELAWRRFERGVAFGQLLNHGGDEVLADLAMAEVVCAPMQTLRRLIPQAGGGEPLMVVVETQLHPATVTVLDAAGVDDPIVVNHALDPEVAAREEQAAIDRRIATLGALIRRGLARDATMIARRARVERARTAADVVREAARAARRGAPSRSDVKRAPATVRAAWPESPAVIAELAAAARARLTEDPVPGSRWARVGECGSPIVEGRADTSRTLPCGMAHVPARSERFLHWYAR